MLTRLSHTQHELVHERGYSENILASLADMLIVTDATGKILRTNGACMDALQYSHEDLLGRPIRHLLKSGDDVVSLLV